MIKLRLTGEMPARYSEGVNALADELGFCFGSEGTEVTCRRGDALKVSCDGERVDITWNSTIQFYRALSLIPDDLASVSLTQSPCFNSVGVMFDLSRNAVLSVDGMKRFLRKMALMGLNLGMLYTEDTYEVPEQPYFGYKRGRLTFSELRELDDYADVFGIELCPCIQTLGHLKRFLHWPESGYLRDNENVLLADSEDTYVVIKQMIRAASAPYRSKRIHLGMDEAHGVGLGSHLRKYGYEEPIKVVQRHLARVLEITDDLGLKPIIWSDMFFRLGSESNDYYDDVMPDQSAVDAVPDGITLVYWDYYNDDPAHYRRMFRKHEALGAEIAFAGGIWTWSGPAPDYEETFSICPPALQACREAHTDTVLATLWGDNGGETNYITALLGMQIFGEYTYTGVYDYDAIKARFRRCCNGEADDFRALGGFNRVPELGINVSDPSNLAKILLYQDPLVQLFEKDMEGIRLDEYYASLEKTMDEAVKRNSEYSDVFSFYRDLACLLKNKCAWHMKAGPIVRNGERESALAVLECLSPAREALERLRNSYWKLWSSVNKSYGYEIIDMRLGGLDARLRSAQERMRAFALGEVDDIPELSETPLPYLKNKEGVMGSVNWMEYIVSASGYDSI